jgi:hypothetical protein
MSSSGPYAFSWLRSTLDSLLNAAARHPQRATALAPRGRQARRPNTAHPRLPSLSSVRRRTLAGILLLIFGGLVDPDEYWASCGAVADREIDWGDELT